MWFCLFNFNSINNFTPWRKMNWFYFIGRSWFYRSSLKSGMRQIYWKTFLQKAFFSFSFQKKKVTFRIPPFRNGPLFPFWFYRMKICLITRFLFSFYNCWKVEYKRKALNYTFCPIFLGVMTISIWKEILLIIILASEK